MDTYNVEKGGFWTFAGKKMLEGESSYSAVMPTGFKKLKTEDKNYFTCFSKLQN